MENLEHMEQNVRENAYDDSQIQVLEGLEAVRKRPGMYIGTTSLKGLHHLVYEIVDNSIDEALAGECDRILIQLNPDDSVTVCDDGRGIPSGYNPQLGLPTLEVVYTVLHAGGKFGGEGYKIAGGLHGVGASVVNALSEWLEVKNHRDGKAYTERFARGKVVEPFTCVGDTAERGPIPRSLRRRCSTTRSSRPVCASRPSSTQACASCCRISAPVWSGGRSCATRVVLSPSWIISTPSDGPKRSTPRSSI